jgi:hypothetical protein
MRGRNPFWVLLVASAAGFCIAVAAYLVAGLGNREEPLNQFFNRHGATLTTGLAVSTMLLGGLALTVDRRQTLRAMADREEHAADRESTTGRESGG